VAVARGALLAVADALLDQAQVAVLEEGGHARLGVARAQRAVHALEGGPLALDDCRVLAAVLERLDHDDRARRLRRLRDAAPAGALGAGRERRADEQDERRRAGPARLRQDGPPPALARYAAAPMPLHVDANRSVRPDGARAARARARAVLAACTALALTL